MEPILPDLSSRPLGCTVEHHLQLSPDVVYGAFTEQFDQWFAAPGTLILKAEINVPFFFETRFEGQRHPHYGRYLALDPGKQLSMAWVTGNPGTLGAETVVDIGLVPHGDGTTITLTHTGFLDEESRDGHAKAWPAVFAHLDRSMAGNAP